MNWLKKGPELKLPKLRGLSGSGGGRTPSIKPPAYLVDLYHDLRDRRLLLPIALVLVAIAAVPFLLGGEGPEVTAPPAATGGLAGARASSSFAVVEANPGLRDYRKRFGDRTATNPFEQRHTSLPSSGEIESTAAESGGGTASDSGSGGGSSIVTDESETGSTQGSGETPAGSEGSLPAGHDGGNGSAGSGKPPLSGRYFAFRPDVRFGEVGSGNLTLYDEMPLGKLLPQENPVVIFIGTSEDGRRVAFDVSDDVSRVRGPGRCVGGKGSCGLLILRSGDAVDLFSSTSGRVFRLAVGAIEFVEVDKPKPASSSSAGGDFPFGISQNFSK